MPPSTLRPVHFGLGEAHEPVSAQIIWPDGQKQIIDDVALNRITEVREPR